MQCRSIVAFGPAFEQRRKSLSITRALHTDVDLYFEKEVAWVRDATDLVLGALNVLDVLGWLVAGVQELGLGEELFLDQTGRGEAQHRVGRSSLVVGAGSTGSTERLLADESGRCLAVWSNWLASGSGTVLREE